MKKQRRKNEWSTGFSRCLSLLVVLASSLAAQEPDPLTRAIEAAGGEAALERVRAISIVMVGTQDLQVIAQGYSPDKPSLRQHQETLLVDTANRRAVLRSEGMSSDLSPTSWRFSAVGDQGFNIKLKTGGVSRLNKEATASLYERLVWSVPHLALADMMKQRDQLRCSGTRPMDGRVYDVCRFKDRLTVLFDKTTGLLDGYEYTAPTMIGPLVMRHQFKEWVRSGAGLFPSGYRFLIGEAVFRDLNVIDARPAVSLTNHPWFVPPPENSLPVASVPSLPPRSVEEIAKGIWMLRNVGGYNVMFAQVKDCIAVFDAPATYGHQGSPIGSPSTPPDLSSQILDQIRETTGKKVCYVIPTHHHSDHLGGIAAFARAGATVLTTTGNVALTRQTLAAAGVSGLSVETVRERMTLGSGDARIDVWVIRNDPHAQEMVFVHVPARGIIFEGDLSDYVLSMRNFRRFIDEKGLKVDKLYGSHSSGAYTLDDLVWEEPVN